MRVLPGLWRDDSVKELHEIEAGGLILYRMMRVSGCGNMTVVGEAVDEVELPGEVGRSVERVLFYKFGSMHYMCVFRKGG